MELYKTSFCSDPSKIELASPKKSFFLSDWPWKRKYYGCCSIQCCKSKNISFNNILRKNIWDNWIAEDSDYHATVYSASTNGWVESTIFQNSIS
jgi:hypothetical protein